MGHTIYALPFSEHIKRYLHGGIKTGVIQRNGLWGTEGHTLSLSPGQIEDIILLIERPIDLVTITL